MLWLLLPCIYAIAQKTAQPGRNVTITNSHISIGDVFNVMERQTGVVLFYSELNTDQHVNVRFVSTPIEDALSEMLPQVGLTYEYVKGNKDKIYVKSVMADARKDTVMVMSVSGVVTDEKGEPLPGASVRVKGTTHGTATNGKGAFTLGRAGEKDVIQVSYTGFLMAEVPVNGRGNVKVQLKQGDNSLDEQVVTAYETTTRMKFTGAMTVIEGKDIQQIPNRSFDKSLQGMVPGLLVTSGTGQPGGGLSNFVLRGISTAGDPSYGSTVRNPLIVIDGVPVSQDNFQFYIDNVKTPVTNPLAQLNPSDIESLTVLKDASAIALYGARASNGVIVVTTKKGRPGKVNFNFRNQTDFSTALLGKIKVLNRQEYLGLLYEAYRNYDKTQYATDEAIFKDLTESAPVKFLTQSNGTFYPETDWYDAIFRHNAVTVANELSMSGGNEKNTYYLNLEYTKQNGVVRSTGYDRKSMRLNFESRPADFLKLGLNSTVSYNVQNYDGGLRGGDPAASAISPLNPVRDQYNNYILNYNAGGGPQSSGVFANPVAAAAYNINRNTSVRVLNKLYGELEVLKNLRLTSNLGFDFMFAEAKEKADPRLYDPGNFSSGVGRIEEQDIRRANVITTNILQYQKRFGGLHSINFLLGQEAQIITQKNLLVAVSNLKLPYYDQINSPGVSLYRYEGVHRKETLQSFFGQINYSYRDRYLLSSSVRRDGSSRFGDERRYGTYWSAGAGYVLSSESFMQRLSSLINYLKVRGSVGAAGNAAAINAFTRYDQLQNATYQGGTAVYPTVQPASPDVQWESTFTWDVGAEIRFFGSRIEVTADIYRRNTSNLIYSTELPQSTGYFSVLRNIGEISNRGVELSLNANIIKTKSLKWTLDANWSSNQNKLIRASTSAPEIYSNILGNKEGENFNSFFLTRWSGVNPVDGSPQWLDKDGKVVSTYAYGIENRVLSGKPQPDGFGSVTNTFSYKGWQLSAMFYYQYGFSIYESDDLLNDGVYPFMNQDRRALDRWRKPGDKASNPARILNNTSQSNASSTRFLHKGDYIRLQNLTLSYAVTSNLLERAKMNSLRIYAQANNLMTWTSYPGGDPGNANVGGSLGYTYPNQRTYSVGLNLGF